MKKYIKIITFIFIIVLTTIFTINFSNTTKKIKINKVLKSEAYTYLPESVQEIVKDTYLETGNIVLTEKNKKENEPYINPKYLAYLGLTDEQKENVKEIPELYTIDYIMDKVNDNTLPSSYDLRNVNQKSYITPLKNQQTLNLCWSFTTLEQAESLLLVKNNTPYTTGAQLFSPKQLDYAASTNGIKDYTNDFGINEINDGGNFLRSTAVLANGVSFYDENDMPFNTNLDQKELYEVLNYNKAKYELNNAIYMPTLSTTATSEEITSYRNTIKEFIMQYGGVYIGSEAPGSCGSSNNDGTYFVRVDDNCVHDSGHAMHVIGWKDDYNYSYCKNGTSHSSNTSSCQTSNLVKGTGAWLVRNSWGNSNSYFYITYDSQDLDFGVTTDISKMSERTWDNNYHNTTNPFSFTISNQVSNTFTKAINTEEKIEKIKFITFRQSGTFRLSVTSNSNNYQNIKEFTVDYPGVYTIDLTNDNIRITDNTFTVKITSTTTSIIQNSIMVFTKNIDSSPQISTDTTILEYDTLTADKTFRLFTKTKNINSNTNVSYKLYNTNNVDYTSYLTVANNIVATNNINPTITIKNGIPNGNYILKINDQKEIPVKIGTNNSIQIKYYSNYGNNNSTTQEVDYNTTTTLLNNSFSRIGYIFNNWNTKADGSGTTYTNKQQVTLTNNLDLYAQWTPITYNIKFNSNGGEGSMSNQTITYDSSTTLKENTFTKTGYIFNNWNSKADGSGTTYTNKQEILNLTTTNNATINLYAQYKPITYKVRFLSNGGEGSMTNQDMTYDSSTTLKENAFTKAGYKFLYWNTKSDGSGTTYTNKQEVVNLTTTNNYVVTLYAIWSTNKYQINYNSNGGIGTMTSENYDYGTVTNLLNNSFTKTGYIFNNWNTKADGSGTSYINKQQITVTNDLDLYAMWTPITYKIKFNVNGGQGTMSNQTFTYDSSTTLKENTFTKIGYKFINWNSKTDGTGTTYANKQEILNLTTVNNSTINLYAQWAPITYNIKFNSNGGQGTMSNQTITYDSSTTLKENTFTKTGYIFNNWNSKADGFGTTYANKQEILNLTTTNNATINLYAQYKPITYKVRFLSNGGEGSMTNQDMTYDSSTTLKENTFTKTGYKFLNWNTKSDGSGTTYSNKQEVVNLTTTNNYVVTLYAIWKDNSTLDYEIDNYVVNEEKLYIDSIEPNTLPNNFINNINLGSNFNVQLELNNKNIIFTGSKTIILHNNTQYKTFTNIVRGDINSDGKITSLDYVKVKNHIMNTNIITDDVYKTSADINKDNKISSLDYVRIKNYIMNGGH